MTDPIVPGVSATLDRVVDEEHCTHRGGYDIFSTPNLVLLLEEAAIDALAPHLDATQSSVGSRIDIAHVAPTLRGQRVSATATVTEVDRRRVAFDITVRDDVEVVGHGTHDRFVVDLEPFVDRLQQKAQAATTEESA